MDLTVGTRLWWVPSQSRRSVHASEGTAVSVVKLGRRWQTLSNGYRIDRDTLEADAGQYMSPGRCYANRETYLDSIACQEAWCRLQAKIGRTYRAPEGSRGR